MAIIGMKKIWQIGKNVHIVKFSSTEFYISFESVWYQEPFILEWLAKNIKNNTYFYETKNFWI